MTEPKPLSTEEVRWLRRLRRVFRDMPARLKLVEAADSLYLVDRAASKSHELSDGGCSDPAVWLADVDEATMKITGVSA